MDINRTLFDFVRRQEWNKIKKYLNDNDDIDVNVRDNNGNYLITYAVLFNKIDIVSLLIHKGAKLDVQDSDGRSILYMAIKYGYIDILKFLLHFNQTTIGVSLVDIQDKNGNISLHYAVTAKDIEIVKILLDAGSNPNFKDDDGFNSLHLAVYSRNINICKLILNSNVNINLKSNTGETALHVACNLELIEILEMLIKRGADVNSQDYDHEYTPLLYSVNKNNPKITAILLKSGANVNKQDFYGNTPLHFCIHEQNFEIFLQLTQSDYTKDIINFNLYNADSKLPIHVALDYQLKKFVKILIKKSNLNFQDSDGNSPLHDIVRLHYWTDFINELKTSKLNVFLKNKYGKRIIDYVKNDKITDFIDTVADSYLYILRNKPYTWKHTWENMCKKELMGDKLTKKEIQEIEKHVNVSGDKDQCKRLVTKKLLDSYVDRKVRITHPKHEGYVELDITGNNHTEFCTFTGVTLDILIGLIHLLKKHKNACSTLTHDFVENKELCEYYKQLGVVTSTQCEFLNFELIWVYQKLYLSDNFFNEFNKCKKKGKRFIVIPLGIELREGSHANYLLYDRKLNEIERFEPYGSQHPFKFNYNPSLLDSVLRSRFEVNLDIKYISPVNYLPKIGFQVLDSFESNCSKIGDPKGFCALWSLWYVDMRIKYPDLNRKILVKEIIKIIKERNFSFKNIIRNYSSSIIDQRDKILKIANININDWLNDKYTMSQMKTVVDELIKIIKTVKN